MSRGKLVWVLMFVVGLSVGIAPYVLRKMSRRASEKPAVAAATPNVAKSYLELPAGWPPEKIRDMGALNDEIARNPGNAKLYIWRSMIHENAKDHEAALRDIDEALKLDTSRRFYFLFMRHKQLEKLGRTDEALADVLEAIRLAPRGTDYQRFAAAIYRGKGDVDAGVAVFEESMRRMPDNRHLLAEKAMFLSEVGRHESALRDISASIEGESNVLSRQLRIFDRMDILMAMRRFDDALEDADLMVDEYPDKALAYGMRSKVYSAMGDHVAARRDEDRKMDLINSNR